MGAASFCFQLAAFSFCIVAAPFACCFHTGSLEKGFQVSVSEITNLQWGKFRPFLGSPAGKFSLGFQEVRNNAFVLSIMFTIGSNSSSQIDQGSQPLNMEMVWSANRNTPSSGDAVLSFNDQGSLVLTEGGAVGVLWSTGGSMGQSLQLQDTGNLIMLRNGSEAWQSFDHPTDTLLAGQNFSASLRLLSSVSESDPSEGSFFLKMEADGMAMYANLNDGAQMYWKKSADQETAVINPQEGPIYARMDNNGYLGMYQTETARVSFQVFITYNDRNVSRRLKIDPDGNLRVYYWQSTSWQIDFEGVEDPCSLPTRCGTYGICSGDACKCPSSNVTFDSGSANVSFTTLNVSDSGQGCAPPDPLIHECSDPRDTFFLQLQGVDSVFRAYAAKTLLNVSSLQECHPLCSSDCSCAAFFYNNNSAANCFLVHTSVVALFETTSLDNLAFIRVTNASAVLAFSSSSHFISNQHPHSVIATVVASLAGALSAILLCALGVWRYRRFKEDDIEREAFLDDMSELPSKRFTYKELEVATSGFRRSRPGGSLGPLYDGVLAGGTVVLVRRVSTGGQEAKKLKAKVAAISRILHENIMRLQGFCIEGNDVVLVYEFGGQLVSLDEALAGGKIGWKNGMEIALGIARALALLHEASIVEAVVHGALTIQNIFVLEGATGDCSYSAKVCDVGVWKLQVGRGRRDATEAEDVYRFGEVLRALIAGVHADVKEKDVHVQMDAKRMETVAALSMQASRPSMGRVVRLLEGTIPLPDFP